MLRQGKVSLLFKRPQLQKMKENISWDHSLVKKYSSSNHLKLIRQLRKEVQKYPLPKKNENKSETNIDYKLDNKDNANNKNTAEATISKNINNNSKSNNISTVSFNNSKNFSIYKDLNNDNKQEKSKSEFYDPNQSEEEMSSSTFKDRLNQIDMK